jgi:hypothetical protein
MEHVKLPIFFHTSTSKGLSDASVEFTLKDCSVIPNVPFFVIDCVLPFVEDNKEYSRIMSSGVVYYSTLTVDEVLYEIELQNEENKVINYFNLLNEN